MTWKVTTRMTTLRKESLEIEVSASISLSAISVSRARAIVENLL